MSKAEATLAPPANCLWWEGGCRHRCAGSSGCHLGPAPASKDKADSDPCRLQAVTARAVALPALAAASASGPACMQLRCTFTHPTRSQARHSHKTLLLGCTPTASLAARRVDRLHFPCCLCRRRLGLPRPWGVQPGAVPASAIGHGRGTRASTTRMRSSETFGGALPASRASRS